MKAIKFLSLLEKNMGKKSLLNHPFYRMWSDGRLPRIALDEYARQYYHLTDNFPRFVASVYKNCSDAKIRRKILDNLTEEEMGDSNNPKPHAVLWLQFCSALGIKAKDAIQSKKLSKTNALLKDFESLTSNDFLSGAACLLAYEMQLPDIAKAKKEGLIKYYNIKDNKGLEFFDVHMEADIRHSKVWKDILIKHAAGSKAKKIMKSFEQSLSAQWRFLDGILEKCLA